MNEEQRQRVGKNEVLFREVNEKVREIDRSHGVPTDEFWEFLCECGDAECLERISLTVAEYEDVRSRRIQFALVPGHETPEVERVVKRSDRFVVAEKHPGERAIAHETHPRS